MGAKAGESYLAQLSKGEVGAKFGVQARMLALAGDPSRRTGAAPGTGMAEELRGMSVTDALAAATGMDKADAKETTDFLGEFLDPAQLNEFKESIISAYTNVDEFNKAQKELARIEGIRAAKARQTIATNLDLIKSVSSLNRTFLLMGQGADLKYKLDQQANKQALAMFKVDQQISKTDASKMVTRRTHDRIWKRHKLKTLRQRQRKLVLKTLEAKRTRDPLQRLK